MRRPHTPTCSPSTSSSRRCCTRPPQRAARRAPRRRRSLENAPGWCRGCQRNRRSGCARHSHPVPGAKTPACPSRGKRSRRSSLRWSYWPGESLYRPAEEAYAAEVRQLSWSNPAIASALQAATTAQLEAVSAPAPPFCTDARAWAQSGYRALSAASREFEASRAARKSSEREAGTFAGHAAEALRERIGSSADPQDRSGRIQARCQRRCRRADDPPPGSNRRVPASRRPKNPSRSPWATGAPPPVLASK